MPLRKPTGWAGEEVGQRAEPQEARADAEESGQHREDDGERQIERRITAANGVRIAATGAGRGIGADHQLPGRCRTGHRPLAAGCWRAGPRPG